MATVNCFSESDLRLYVLGRLSERLSRRVENHLQLCPECQATAGRLDKLKDPLVTGLRQALGRPPEADPTSVDETTDPSVQPTASATPVRVGDYEILGELSRGGMSVIYTAREENPARQVAIKMLLVGAHASTEQRVRILAEADAIAGLDHPNIIRIHKVGLHDGLPFLVLEYMGKGSLKDWLGGQPQPPRPAAAFVEALARAVAFAHEKGIVHRDLKPANVLLAPIHPPREGLAGVVPRITDFGLAKKFAGGPDLTATGVVMGTPGYMAPEQAQGKADVGPPADVYALGAILYEILTGTPPFKAATPSETIDQVVNRDPVAVRQVQPGVPADLETVCLKCLQKDPKSRYASAAALAEDLRRFQAGEPIVARQVGRVEWFLGWCRRNPRVAGLLATVAGLLVTVVLVLAAAAGVSTYFYFQAREQARVAEARQVEADRNADLARAETLQRLTASAQNRLRRGLLGQAEQDYDRALEIATAAEQRQIEVQRLRCLFAFGRWDRLREELERLAACPDLTPQQRAEVLLHQGDLDLWQTGDEWQRRGLDRLRQAVALNALAPADQAYARGVLAEGPKSAVAAFEEAVLADGYHLRANAALLMELCFSGQFDLGRRQARFMRAAFPREPVVPLALAVMATLEDDQPARRRHRDELARLVDPVRMAGLDEALRIMEAGARFKQGPVDWLRAAWNGPRGLLGNLTWAFGARVKQMFRHEGVGEAVGIGLPLLLRPQKLIQDLTAAERHLAKHRLAEAENILVTAERERSESVLYLMLGQVHLYRGVDAMKCRDGKRTVEEYRLAHEYLARAVDAPALLPNALSQRIAAWGWLLFEVAWAQQAKQTRVGAGCAAALAGHPLLALAPLLHGQSGLVPLPPPADGHILRRLLEPSRGPDPDRADLLPKMIDWMDPDEARYLLRCWRRDEPRNVAPYQLQARLELRAGNPRGSLDWAQRGLAVRPGDAKLRELERQAREALAPAVPPPRTSSRPGG